jgi:adenylate cyclase
MLIRLRGPGGTYPHVSAADVMSGRVARDTLAGRVVFVGATASGIRDTVATAIDTAFPGVEVHATVADALLGGASSRRPTFANLIEAVLAVAASIAAVAVVLWTGALGGSLIAAGGAGAAWFAAQALYQASGTVVSPVGTIAGLAAGAGIAAAYRVTAGRRRADHERLRREQAQRLIVQTLTSLTETRDLATGHHARRTQEYVRLLASALASHPAYSRVLTSEYIDLIATLAPLHDIGKVGISDAVLNKPGHLNATETAEMRTHAALGHESLLKAEHLAGVHDNEVLRVAKDIVYTHHERWDGSGYPRGLRGTEIPLPGRIVAVVDVYDALIAERSYKAALPHERALQIITQGRGVHFDPDVVDAFLQIQHRLDEVDHADEVRLPAPPG